MTWERIKVGDLGRVVTGKTPKTAEKDNYNGNIMFVTPSDDMDAKYIYSTGKTITEKGMQSVKGAIIPAGAICVSCIGSDLGKVVITTEECVTNQQINSIIIDASRFDTDFIYYSMLILGKELNFHSKTSTAVPIVNKSSFSSYEIKCPPLEEQKKIAGVLSTIDEKRERNERINDNLLQQAQAIYKHIFGDNSTVTAATIADIALNVTDGVHNTVKDDPEGQYLLLSCKNIKGGLLSIGSSERKINSETFEKLRRRTKLAKGDILISSVGTVGELLLLNTDPSNYEFQRSVAIVKPNPELVSSAYVYESLVAKKAELINAAHGAVQQCLFISDIAGFPIGIPNPAALRSFDEVVKPMFDTITANEAENLRLEALRDTLLPKLMSGELDVSELDL